MPFHFCADELLLLMTALPGVSFVGYKILHWVKKSNCC